jgi:YidC/Oxa1 family membrane protein insertase
VHEFVLATSWLDPIVNVIAAIVNAIDSVVHNRGWSLIVFALAFRLVFWPLNTAQFKSMLAMNKLGPKIKALKERYKDDPQKMQQAQMELFKKEGANPLAGCWPILVQYPVIIGVLYAVLNNKVLYTTEHWGWIGTPIAAAFPKIFAQNLAQPDVVLLVLYAISLYVSMRYTTMPPTDPAQAQQMKIMQFISPLMLGFFGFKYQWPSAMVLYWFFVNVFTMAQQLYLLRRYHQPLSVLDSEHAITENVVAEPEPSAALPSKNGSSSRRNRKRSRR